MSESDSQMEAGTVLDDRYELADEIARGGFGRVYRARQMNMDREVAVKMLPPKFMDLPDVVQRFEREARLASRLSHPNTITVHDYGQHGDFLFLVMELLEGEDLADILAREGRLSLDRIARIARQVLKSLNEAHQHNIVHRDLKPENIFLSDISGEQDFVKVVDFGIAKLAMTEMDAGQDDSHRSLTVEGNTVGTPTYMSPEQAAGGDVDARSDLYALGVILFEMAAGRPPFDHDDVAKLMRKHIFEEIPAFDDEKLRGSWLDSIVSRAMEKEKEDRFQDASAFIEALDYAIEAANQGKRAFAPTREQSQIEVDEGDSLQQDSDALFPSDNERSHTDQGAENPAVRTPSGGATLSSDVDSSIEAPSKQGNTSSSIVTVLEPGSEEDVIVLDEPKEEAAGDQSAANEGTVATESAPRADGGRTQDRVEPTDDSPTSSSIVEPRPPEVADQQSTADGGGGAPAPDADESWSWDDSVPQEEFQAASHSTTIDSGTNWGWIFVWLLVAAGAATVAYLYATGQLPIS